MTITNDCGLGFRIVGDCRNERRLVDWRAAFASYCALDDRIDPNSEAFLSAWTFTNEIRTRQDKNYHLQTKGYTGVCGGDWLWIDIDREEDLGEALRSTREIVRHIIVRYRINPEEMLVFFSGKKGFHVGLPSIWFAPKPSTDFSAIAKHVCFSIADAAGVAIDSAIYDRVRAFRAPNSKHPKTGLHKITLNEDELFGLTIDGILAKAKHPNPQDVTENTAFVVRAAVDDWEAADIAIKAAGVASDGTARQPSIARLNHSTRLFLRDGCGTGERAKMLFSSAANLAELGCPLHAVSELLTEAGLDSGLPPSEVRRQIQCGFDHAKGAANAT